ncbi:MAG TPA: GtrA family protein [Caulobacteraceae bacterium]|jgi:putative flippase GtrA
MRPFERVARYYFIGGVNTAFGFALYSALVWLGFNLYLAQLISYPFSVAFNYFTYSRHVFPGEGRRPAAFIGAYAYNYLQTLALLAIVHTVVANPYAAGFIALIIGTAINYFVLRRFVFRPPAAPSDTASL